MRKPGRAQSHRIQTPPKQRSKMPTLDMQNLLIDEGGPRKEGGLQVKAKAAFWSDVATFPAQPASPATFGAAAASTGNFAMKTDKYFKEWESDLEWSGLDVKSQGEMNHLSAQSTYDFEVAGWPADIMGFLQANANRPLVILVKDIAGVTYQLGDQMLPAKITEFALNGGKKTSEKKSISFKVYYPGRIPMIYAGTDPATGA